MTQKTLTRIISIDDWCALAKEGAAPAVTITLDGYSMLPLIRRGIDPVTVIPLQRPVKRGDVVLFTAGSGAYIVHRVWKIRDDCVQTLGDNCVQPDPWIPHANVLGHVIHFSRNNIRHRLDTASARLWGRMWMALFPFRKYLFRLRSFIGRCLRRFFK